MSNNEELIERLKAEFEVANLACHVRYEGGLSYPAEARLRDALKDAIAALSRPQPADAPPVAKGSQHAAWADCTICGGEKKIPPCSTCNGRGKRLVGAHTVCTCNNGVAKKMERPCTSFDRSPTAGVKHCRLCGHYFDCPSQWHEDRQQRSEPAVGDEKMGCAHPEPVASCPWCPDPLDALLEALDSAAYANGKQCNLHAATREMEAIRNYVSATRLAPQQAVMFEAACSGLRYTKPGACGEVAAVWIGDDRYTVAPAKAKATNTAADLQERKSRFLERQSAGLEISGVELSPVQSRDIAEHMWQEAMILISPLLDPVPAETAKPVGWIVTAPPNTKEFFHYKDIAERYAADSGHPEPRPIYTSPSIAEGMVMVPRGALESLAARPHEYQDDGYTAFRCRQCGYRWYRGHPTERSHEEHAETCAYLVAQSALSATAGKGGVNEQT